MLIGDNVVAATGVLPLDIYGIDIKISVDGNTRYNKFRSQVLNQNIGIFNSSHILSIVVDIFLSFHNALAKIGDYE